MGTLGIENINHTVYTSEIRSDETKSLEHKLITKNNLYGTLFVQDSTDEQIPMCIIGNKVDLREDLPEGSCVSSVHGEKLAKVHFPVVKHIFS